MLLVSEELSDKGFFQRLNSLAGNAVPNDVMYYNLCWADAREQSLNAQ